MIDENRRVPNAAEESCRALIARLDNLLHPEDEGESPSEAHRVLHELAHEFEILMTAVESGS
jgi:hypothetical protein